MATTTNPSKRLAESLALFSKAAYQALADVELQSRQDITHAATEARAARSERDKALKEIHALGIDLQSWKEQASAAEAALTQAELTISHQRETIANQVETIGQLRRELSQWKDQSRNWQDHFLRVEQERCAQSSRMDELLLENLQYSRASTNPNTLITPPKGKYLDGASSAPSTMNTKRSTNVVSPTMHRTDVDSGTATDGSRPSKISPNSRKSIGSRPDATQAQSHPHPIATESSSNKAKPSRSQTSLAHKATAHHNAQTHPPQVQNKPSQSVPSRPPAPVVLRRVQAVINVKQEDDSDEDNNDVSQDFQEGSSTRKPKRNASVPNKVKKEKQESIDRGPLNQANGQRGPSKRPSRLHQQGHETSSANDATTRRKMRPRKAVDYTQDLSGSEREDAKGKRRRDAVGDENDENELDDDEEEERAPRASSASSKRFRSRGRYIVSEDEGEEDEVHEDVIHDDEDEEDDELMLGAGDDFDEDEGGEEEHRRVSGGGRGRPSPRKKRKFAVR